MLYPFMTLPDETEIVHSEILLKNNKENVKVYIEDDKIKEVIIVEGKYDKIKLDSMIDATVIATDGFRLFKDKEKKELIKY